jgi:hypothetical protein
MHLYSSADGDGTRILPVVLERVVKVKVVSHWSPWEFGEVWSVERQPWRTNANVQARKAEIFMVILSGIGAVGVPVNSSPPIGPMPCGGSQRAQQGTQPARADVKPLEPAYHPG